MRRLLIALLAFGFTASCGRSPLSPPTASSMGADSRAAGGAGLIAAGRIPVRALTRPSSREHGSVVVPLAEGTVWVYDGLAQLHRVGDPPGADLVTNYHEHHRAACRTALLPGGGRYRVIVIDGTYVDPSGGGEYTQQRLYRQDPGGLYQQMLFNDRRPICPDPAARIAGATLTPFERLASDPATSRAASAAARYAAARMRSASGARLLPDGLGNLGNGQGALDCESRELLDPLYRGRHWTVTAECSAYPLPLLPREARVLGMMRLEIPPALFDAWQILITGADDGPSDYFLEWYGAVGLLGYWNHVEFDGVNSDGLPDGSHWESDESIWLTSFQRAPGAVASSALVP